MLTGDSFFHLSAYGEALPGLNLCGAGRVVCLIDPVGDVYACPFAIHDAVPGRQRARADGGFDDGLAELGAVPRAARAADRRAPAAAARHYDSCRGGCMAAKFFTGLPLDGPDPECVQGNGERGPAAVGGRSRPRTTRTPARSATPRCR